MGKTNNLISRVKPGYWLYILIFWWVIPVFLLELSRYPLFEYLNSYCLYFTIFGITITIGLMINLVDRRFRFWDKIGLWRKYLIIGTVYTIDIVIILFIDGFLGFDTFRSDPEGSIGMLFMPSIYLYFVVGAIVTFVCTFLDRKYFKAM